MGVYIFTAEKMYKYLKRTKTTRILPKTSAKTSFPPCSTRAKRCLPYLFEGYWKDVGTVSSLWEANMDLLGENPAFDVADNGVEDPFGSTRWRRPNIWATIPSSKIP